MLPIALLLYQHQTLQSPSPAHTACTSDLHLPFLSTVSNCFLQPRHIILPPGNSSSTISSSPIATSVLVTFLYIGHQQKKHLLQTDRHRVRTQEIRREHPVHPAHPQRAAAEWLHPSPLGAIQPASCPPSAPGWAISHPNLPKNTKVSHQGGFPLVISPCP